MSIDIQKSIKLAPYTTLKIGGSADFFVDVKAKDEILEALDWAQENKQPWYILSGGSNVLVSDDGFRGLIIHLKNTDLSIEATTVIAGAALSLPLLAKKTTEAGLTGLEFAIGVPGTVGGAVYGNAGAFQQETKDVLTKIEVLVPEKDSYSTKIFTNNECKFDYRESIFKKNKNWIILTAEYELKKEDPKKCTARMLEMLKDKTTNQPMGKKAAGSIFKNPPGHSSWELVAEAEMRGYKIGGAQVSEQHTNYIINTGGSTAEHVLMLIAMIKQRVRVRSGVQLQEEIQYVGF